jgi:ferredoxin
MADPNGRFEKNVEGRYFVDVTCIYCDLCREVAPTIFAENKDSGIAYVFKQPETDEENELAREALEGCPTESIGDMENPGIERIRYGSDVSPIDPGKKWWQFRKS